MNIQFFCVGVLSLAIGLVMMMKSKFWKYETGDMMFAAKLRSFLGFVLVALFGILILINELKKIVL